MAKNKLFNTLINLGLTENEAAVYLASLSIGPSTILNISKTANIKRTTVYSVVESLKQKGLMNMELRGWKQLYVAENPDKLKSILNQRQEKLKENMPEFMALYNFKGGESFIKYYEGMEAIKSVYERLIKEVRTGEDYYITSNLKDIFTLDKEFFIDFSKRRSKLNINIKLLLENNEEGKEYKKYDKIFNQTSKLFTENIKLKTNLVVIPSMMVVHQLAPPVMAIVIENQSIIQMQKQFFEIIWSSIKE